MNQLELDEFEFKVLETIRNSKDPVKALGIAIDVVSRMLMGESHDSIMESYGIELEEVISA